MARQIPQTISQEGLVPALKQGAELAATPVAMETKPGSFFPGPEGDHRYGDEEGLVPVIVSLGDNPPTHKDRKCVTTEVPMKDIISGAPCTLEGIKNSSL